MVDEQAVQQANPTAPAAPVSAAPAPNDQAATQQPVQPEGAGVPDQAGDRVTDNAAQPVEVPPFVTADPEAVLPHPQPDSIVLTPASDVEVEQPPAGSGYSASIWNGQVMYTSDSDGYMTADESQMKQRVVSQRGY